jgi:plasmid maintenance system antidote protein VapI
MRLLASTTLALGVVLGTGPDLWARVPAAGDVQLITGSARIVRGRVRRARGAATHQALVAAVWRRVQPRLASGQAHRRLKRRLSRRVRKLIKRYRTRRITRAGRRLTVLLAVTVDEPALRARLRALRVRLERPGVLLLVHCDQGSLAPPLTRALQATSIRVVTGPWSAVRRAAMVQTAQSQPTAVLPWAREAHAAAVVLARCETQVRSRIVASGVTGVRAKVVAVVYAPQGRTQVRLLLRIERSGLGHHVDVKRAGQAAVAQALGKVARRLGPEVSPRLPAGLTRTLLVRLRGPLGLGTLLKMTRQIAVQLQGVHAVTPQRFQRGVTWLAVQTIYDLARLQQVLTTVRPPAGWLLRVGKGPRPGTLDIRAELTEES